MKNIYLLLSLLFVSTLSFSQWSWQNRLPQGNPLNSVYFIDANTGYIVGELGTILKTINGGANWTIQTSGTTKVEQF